MNLVKKLPLLVIPFCLMNVEKLVPWEIQIGIRNVSLKSESA